MILRQKIPQMKKFLLLTLLFCLSYFQLLSQQTVGLYLNEESAFNGYTLLAPSSAKTTYLMNNCGEVVHSWDSNYTPGKLAFLMENGDLLRPAQIPNQYFNGGGSAGNIERFNWNGDLIWSYVYSDSLKHSHHDVEIMPNGNILVIAWEYRSEEEAIENGRNPESLMDGQVWPTQVVELQPTGFNDAEIVWEWHVWDHLIQDFDPTKANFGLVSEHPELLDINFGTEIGQADWIHVNGIDYNENLDQIILSSRHLSEIWIIDHSTTTEEAASHEGGIYGKGGDFLYRYGNPRAYQQGTLEDKKLFGPHDVRWIEEGYLDAGKIMVFNNGLNRPQGLYSTVEVIEPPMDYIGNYLLGSNNAYGPDTVDWLYPEEPDLTFFSSNISGANRLPNGNTLICEGRFGELIEVNPEGETVWRYVNPMGVFGPIGQGNPPIANSVFQVFRYGPDYPAFENKVLVEMGPIELNPLISTCELFTDSTLLPIDTTIVDTMTMDTTIMDTMAMDTTIMDTTIVDTISSLNNLVPLQNFHLYPNPFEEVLNLEILETNNSLVQIAIFDWNGQLIFEETVLDTHLSIDSASWAKGLYFVRVSSGARSEIVKVVK